MCLRIRGAMKMVITLLATLKASKQFYKIKDSQTYAIIYVYLRRCSPWGIQKRQTYLCNNLGLKREEEVYSKRSY